MELVTYAILWGIILSFILIGPVFFMLLETSVSRGWKAAIALDLGVLTSDLICILIAYYGSKDLALIIQNTPSVYVLGGFFIFIYGLVMFVSKPNLKMRHASVATRSYLKTFLNGFLLNILNIGVIVFWFFIVSTVVIQYPDKQDALLYMFIVLITFFSIDLFKIFLANKVKEKFTLRRVFYFKKIIGLILLILGIVVILKGFGAFSKIDDMIEEEIKKGMNTTNQAKLLFSNED